MIFFSNRQSLLAINDAFKYAVMATLSMIISTIMIHFFSINSNHFTLYIIGSSIFVFFCYGETLVSQLLLLLLGTVLTACLCVIGLLLSAHLWACALFVVASAAVVFFYSTVNMGATVMAKLVFCPVSFCVVSALHTPLAQAGQTGLTILSAGCSAAVANLIVYVLSAKQPEALIYKKWSRMLITLLNKLSANLFCYQVDHFDRQGQMLKKSMVFVDPKHAMIIDRINNSLSKFIQLIERNPSVVVSLEKDCGEVFLSLQLAMRDFNPSQVDLAEKNWKKMASQLKKGQAFKHLPYLGQIRLVRSLYMIEVLIKEMRRHLQYGPHAPSSQSMLASMRKLWVRLKKNASIFKAHSRLLDQGRINTQVKVAIRAAVAMGAAFFFARYLNSPHSAWIILTTGIVIQVRYGDTLKKCLERIAGHFVGFAAAFFLYQLFKIYPVPLLWGALILFGCAYFLLKNYFIFGVFLMTALIYVNGIQASMSFSQPEVLHFLTLRLVDVTLGSLIALLASCFIFKRVGFVPISHISRKMTGQLAKFVSLVRQDQSDTRAHQKIYAQCMAIESSLMTNASILKSRSFQPSRYRQNFKRDLMLHDILERLYKELESFSRCYHFGLQQKARHPKVADFLAHSLSQLSVELEALSKSFDLLDQNQEEMIHDSKGLYQLNDDVESYMEQVLKEFHSHQFDERTLIQAIGQLTQLSQVVCQLQKTSLYLRSLA